MWRNIALLGMISIVSSLLLWLPFASKVDRVWGIDLGNKGMLSILANYDGPLYIAVAKTFYNFSGGNPFEFSLPNEYYAAHLPFFPITIALLSWLMSFPYAMLASTLAGSVLAVSAFYLLCNKYFSEKTSLDLSVIMLFFPARVLVVRSVGSPEMWFIFSIIASLYFYSNKKYFLAAVFGSISTITKSPGILLFFSYLIDFLITKSRKENLAKFLPLLLIPLSLIGVFGVYQLRMNDFLAYFHSGDNIHLQSLPFRVFDTAQSWVGTHWLEDVIWIYLAGLVGAVRLFSQKKTELAVFVSVFLVSIFFVSHRDIPRYSLPIFPFILISFGEYIKNLKFRWVFAILLVPIYLYSINFILNNQMQISNWGPLN